MKVQKLLIMLFLALITVNQVSAQRLKKERLVTYQYIQLPTNPLPENYKIYLLNITSVNPERRDMIYSNFIFAGFEKKRSGVSDFNIEIEEYPLKTGSEKLSHVVTKKKDGVETKKTYYYLRYNLNYKLGLRMTDKNGEEMYSTFANIDQSGRTTDCYNYKEAYAQLRKDLSNKKRISPKLGAINLSKNLNSKFGYPKKTKSLVVFKVKPKKFNYDDFEKAYNIAAEAAKIIKADMNATGKCMEAYVPAIQIWEKALEESDLTKKKTRVNKNVTCACYYNMGNAYLLCENYDKAIENFNKVLDIDKKFSNADILLRFAKDMKKRTEANL